MSRSEDAPYHGAVSSSSSSSARPGASQMQISTGAGSGSNSGGGAGMPGPSMPARPARSVRRPGAPGSSMNNSSSLTSGSSNALPGFPARAQQQQQQQQQQPQPVTRAGRLAQAILREEEASGLSRSGSRMSTRSASPVSGDEGDSFLQEQAARLEQHQRAAKAAPVLEKAVAAFASSSPAAATARNGRGRQGSEQSLGKQTTGRRNDEQSATTTAASRTRRGAVGVQGESARARGGQAQDFPETPAFREMERVLAQISHDWPEVIPGVSEPLDGDLREEDETGQHYIHRRFDPVTLALSLVDPNADSERLRSFLLTKDALSRSLKSSIQTHYRAFDSSVSAYNGLQANLTAAQKNTSNLRTTLEEVREILGKGRTELGVLEARRTELAEMDRILASLETLKNVPDKLESLMTEKHFLSAAVLLVRSLKIINRGEIREIAATADLRAYFVSQENLLLEYLTEELHNHLYLKSFYTESRWKQYTAGQTELPVFLVESAPRSIFDYSTSPDLASDGSKGGAGALSANSIKSPKAQTRLHQFLTQVSKRSGSGPLESLGMDESVPLESLLDNDPAKDKSREVAANGLSHLTRSGSTASVNVAGGPPSASVVDEEASSRRHTFTNGASRTIASNPEQDSFAYIEVLLTSLAYLGKLSFAMDSVLQRGPLEIYNLVEATATEVDERNDPIRRQSMQFAQLGASSKLFFSASGTYQSSSTATAYSLMLQSHITSASFGSPLSDENGSGPRSPMTEINTEILMDFFWTLFSKLDAVLQGFRILFEIVQRLADRKDGNGVMGGNGASAASASAAKDANLVNTNDSLLYSLNDIWRPIQSEIQALLHDYLIDEQNGSSGSSRHHIASINDTLKSGRPIRDGTKALFKFSDSDAKSSSRSLRTHEESLNRSLKTSVPGLVSTLAEGATATIGSIASSSSSTLSTLPGAPATATTWSGNAGQGPPSSPSTTAVAGRTHRMLVPPNAFRLESLVLPTLKFLERAKDTLPEGMVNFQSPADQPSTGASASSSATQSNFAANSQIETSNSGNNNNNNNSGIDLASARRFSGLMDDETLERLAPALNEWYRKNNVSVG